MYELLLFSYQRNKSIVKTLKLTLLHDSVTLLSRLRYKVLTLKKNP